MSNTNPFHLTPEDRERLRLEHEQFLAQQDRALQEQFVRREAEEQERQRSKEEARKEWLAQLKGKEEERRKVAEAKLEEELQPQREKLLLQWLSAGKTEADFMQVWPRLRQGIVEDRRRELLETEREKMRTSGNYQL